MINIYKRFLRKVQIVIYKRKEEHGNAKKSNSLHFSHVTYYMVGNAGDTALSQCVRKVLEKNFMIKWNLISVNKKVTKHVIRYVNKSEALIIGGGGLFLPDTNANKNSGWQWAIKTKDIENIKVPILIYSVGYNFFKGQEPDVIFLNNLKALCKKASFIGLRNMGSVLAIKSLLSDELGRKIVYQPCITTLIRKVYENAIPPKQRSYNIAVNMAFDREKMRYGGKKDKILNQISLFCKFLIEKGYHLILLYHMDEDKKIKPYIDKYNLKYEEVNLTSAFPDQIFRFYNNIEMVIGMRGHAQMIPFGLNCEIISLGTHDKIRWFLEDIDALDWYVDLIENADNLNIILQNKFIEIHEKNRDITQKRLLSSQEKLWDITQENLSIIKKILRV